MFRELVNAMAAAQGGAGGEQAFANQVLTQYTPTELDSLLRRSWQNERAAGRALNLPAVQPLSPLIRAQPGTPEDRSRRMAGAAAGGPALGLAWPHLIYAYMVENTGAIEIFRRVVTEWISGERLPYATLETQYWLRNTEVLFFTSPHSAFHSLTSELRPDSGEIRENAYQRLLGLELSFRREGRPPRPRPAASNNTLMRSFERLLYEVWRGYINSSNSVGENRTDTRAILELVGDMREMLNTRRTHGTLMLEEFSAISTASWFFLTVSHENAVTQNLNAQAQSPAARLSRIAEMVGMQASRAADHYFTLAEPLSRLFIDIEDGSIEAVGPQVLYDGVTNGAVTQELQQIITHYGAATGRSVKDVTDVRPVQVSVPSAIGTPASVLNRLANVPLPV